MNNKDVYNITWQGIDIQITVEIPDYLKITEEFDGYKTFHIEVETISPLKTPLPITETGYKSIFIPEPELSEYGGVVEYILDNINNEARSTEWKEKCERARQYALF